MKKIIRIIGKNLYPIKNYKHTNNLLFCKVNKLMSTCGLINSIFISSILLSSLNLCNAAGFAVLEQSVNGLGTAYSGGTAGGEDISTIFYNPAGLSEYSGTEVILGTHFILPDVKFKVDGSSDSLNRPLTGHDGSNIGKKTLIPNFFLATDLPGSFRLGLGITVPFGLGSKFAKDWQGRYEAIDSQLKTIDINPAISYAFNDKVSIGFGLSAQYIDVELTNAIDFGMLCFAQLGAATCSGLGLSPQAADGYIELEESGWSWGYNVGILFKPIPNLRIGIAYRSKVNHQLNGHARFNVPASAQPLTATGAFRNTHIESEADLPASMSIGAIYEAKEQWTILWNLTWTHWNQLDKLIVNFDNPSQPSSSLDFNFKNTIRTSLGSIYQINPAWTLRAGFAYDESPVRNSRSRTFRVPDNDRYWLTLGIGYQPNSNLKFNLAYAHIFIKDALIEREDSLGHRIRGRLESEIDIVSVELQWAF